MTHDINAVKQIISTFVYHQIDHSFPVPDTKETARVNASLFELQHHLYKLIRKYSYNANIDCSIISPHILAHLHVRDVDYAYRPCDYQFNFLYHLAQRYHKRMPLVNLINSFIRRFKHELKGADLVMTKSGATRCKTNVRFALNGLREMGLVLRKKDDHRSWSPSILGLVALLNVAYSKNIQESPFCKHAGTLKTRDNITGKIVSSYSCDPTLMASLAQFHNDPMHLYTYLDKQQQHALTEEEKEILQSIMERYLSFVEDSLEILPDGVRKKKDFIKKSKLFQEDLFAINEANEPFFEKLFAHFQGLAPGKQAGRRLA